MNLLKALRWLARRIAAAQPTPPVEDDLDEFGDFDDFAAEDAGQAARRAEAARRAAEAERERDAAENFDTLDYADGERDGRIG